METKKEFIQKLLKWMKKNAMCQTTYSDMCWDDGDIMFKRHNKEKQGDWTQTEWDEKIKDFKEQYIDYQELLEYIEKQK